MTHTDLNERARALQQAALALVSESTIEPLLQTLAEQARLLTQARYAAIGVLGDDGGIVQFITSGLTAEERARLGSPPTGQGVLGLMIREKRPIRLKDIAQDPASVGFPPHHPPMRSFLGVPILSRGQVFGNLYLTEREGGSEFTQEDEDLVQAFAAYAAVAIDNAGLYQETQEGRLLAALNEIARDTADLVDADKALPAIRSVLLRLLPFDRLGIALLEPQKDFLQAFSLDGDAEGAPPPEFYPLTPAARDMALRRQGDVFPDLTQSGSEAAKKLVGDGFQSTLSVPLVSRGQVVGFLNLVSRRKGGFAKNQVPLVQAIADQIAPVMQNARMYQELRRGNQFLAVLNEIARKADTLDERTMGPIIRDLAAQVIRFDWLAISLLNAATQTIQPLYAAFVDGRESRLGNAAPYQLPSMLRALATERRGQVFPDLTNLHTPRIQELVSEGILSTMTTALVSRGTSVGFLTVGSKRNDAFGKGELSYLQAIADQIAPVIENARLYQEVQRSAEFNAALNEIARVAAQDLDIRAIFPTVEQALRRVVDFNRIVIALLESDRQADRVFVSITNGVDTTAGEDVPVPLPPGAEDILSGKVPALIRPDTTRLGGPRMTMVVQKGILSTIAVPLVCRGETIGFFTLGATKKDAYAQRHVPLVRAIADQLAPLVENGRLYRELRHSAVSRALVGQILHDLQAAGSLSEGPMFRAGQDMPERQQTSSLEEFLESFAGMGLGTLTLVEEDADRQRWTFLGDRLVEVRAAGLQPTCHYTRGYLCGVLVRLRPGANFVAAETACQSFGDACCRFIVQMVESPPVA